MINNAKPGIATNFPKLNPANYPKRTSTDYEKRNAQPITTTQIVNQTKIVQQTDIKKEYTPQVVREITQSTKTEGVTQNGTLNT